MPDLSDISKALNFGKDCLSRSSVEDAELSVEILVSEVVGLSRQALYSHFEDKLTAKQQELYKEHISRRANHEPIQYILGYTYFCGLKIEVGPGVLIPRPETEQLVQRALDEVAKQGLPNIKVLDLCTGSACIACSLAEQLPNSKIIATDLSDDALKYARKNIVNLGFSDRIDLVKCNMADELRDSEFDLIISNPPYVPTEVYENLDSEVLDYEPKLALEAGEDGTLLLEEIIATSKEKLKPGGIVALEFHEENLEIAKSKFEEAGFKNIKIHKDLAGKDRIIIACK